MVLHWGDGGTGSKQVLSRHVPLLGRGHTLAHPPMPYGALFTYLCPPSSPDIVYMAGPEISSAGLRRGGQQSPKSDRQAVRADRDQLIE